MSIEFSLTETFTELDKESIDIDYLKNLSELIKYYHNRIIEIDDIAEIGKNKELLILYLNKDFKYVQAKITQITTSGLQQENNINQIKEKVSMLIKRIKNIK